MQNEAKLRGDTILFYIVCTSRKNATLPAQHSIYNIGLHSGMLLLDC